jgi:hypothetical protein
LVDWFIHKAKTEELKTEVQQHQTGLTSEEHRFDRCATTQAGDFEAEARVGIARLASRLSMFVVAGHPSDGVMTESSEFALEGHVSLVSY